MAKIEVRIADIIEMLDKGMKRGEIKAHYDLTNNEMKELFSHPKLKGRKAKAPSRLIIIEDSTEVSETVGSEEEAENPLDIAIENAVEAETVKEELEEAVEENLQTPAEDNEIDKKDVNINLGNVDVNLAPEATGETTPENDWV